MAYVALSDRGQVLSHPHSWITKYVWSQDHKVIAIQYAITAIAVGVLALVLSAMMRLQLGFPDTLSIISPSEYYQYVTMHGMIMVIYLLTALFLGGFGNYLIPLMVGARDMVFPYMNMLSYWVYLGSVLILMASFFVPGGPTGAGWTLYPPQAIMQGTPGADWGIILMLISLAVFIVAFTMGGTELRHHGSPGTYSRHDDDTFAVIRLGYFYRNHTRASRLPGTVGECHHDDTGPAAGYQLLHAGDCFHGRTDQLRWWQSGIVPTFILVLWAS